EELDHRLVARGVGRGVAALPELLPAVRLLIGRQGTELLDLPGLGDVGERLEQALELLAARRAALLDLERARHAPARAPFRERHLELVAADEQLAGRGPHGHRARGARDRHRLLAGDDLVAAVVENAVAKGVGARP